MTGVQTCALPISYEYLEYDFARGMYGDAALELTQALERWYETYFD